MITAATESPGAARHPESAPLHVGWLNLHGRTRDAARRLRAAESFMFPDDPRKMPTRCRLTTLLREAYDVKPAERRDVSFAGGTLPTYCFAAEAARGTIVAFGGFDSYIEEFLPILLGLRDCGWTVIAFEGPGQGAVLEDQRMTMTPEWHGPVAAVLDAFALDDVTLVGISLGGCLAIRAAARGRRRPLCTARSTLGSSAHAERGAPFLP